MNRLLVANRGEIARRVMRTAHAMGIATVAVHSDADAGAMHVAEATQAFALGGLAAADSYLRIDRLLAAARTTGADAVHPGYGFLSENADFAQAVVDAGLVWVGPPPAAIRVLGSKSGVKRLAAELGIPCLPGYAGEDQSDERFEREAARIGYPVMVKAAAGGGGRGMRLVTRAPDLLPARRSARSEAESAFGSGELLLERALLAPRHVEVQLFADTHGRCIHLGERDCSVQRRHQKIIEESPSPAVDAALRERIGEFAVRLALRAGYVGAGTVEFLLDGDGEPQFFLMEMNTRLQVEHPVTEALTGVDLVEWQLRIARGEPLPMQQADVRLQGHAIEVRLCAEDEQFAPHAGTVRRFVAPQGVRFDHALRDGAQVPPYYDSMLGKLIAHAPTRDEAIARLVAALQRTTVLGLPTNRGLLIECLKDPVFHTGDALIPFLDERGEALREHLAGTEVRLAPLLFAAVWALSCAPSDGPLPPPFERPMRLRHREHVLEARLREQAPNALRVAIGTDSVLVHRLDNPPRLVLDGAEHAMHGVAVGPGQWHLQLGGTDLFVADASFEPAANTRASAATEIKAPFSGRVVALHAAAGQQVSAGETLVVIEAMKLEHAISAPRNTTIASIAVELGQQVSPQQLLLTLETA
ncbi:acetyl/propionyl/methylcrotonyl-CoA carboxylase subunit alpha [Piscinibacter sp.]|uniref:acetyl/propionyl/methylcrotonyl-CoA carboxylase subunit alpha n=1 Tax=Piscinibacter sp. TaxID=1903157 RepID=UPI002BB3D41F|nr:biotin carboxylase N-terminal domain-containing protein [Albitalea sp.]HUG25715.1 biotin carboxylase N-terminal domain-containing protein [Albitalea sp.]